MEANNDVYWSPAWFTIPEFSDVTPVDLRHREQEAMVLPAEAMEYKNIHVLVRGKFNLKHGGNFCLKISADDRYKLYLDGGFIQEGPAPPTQDTIIIMRLNFLACHGENTFWEFICITRDVSTGCFTAEIYVLGLRRN